ncbi:MAG: hypothetical protein H6739_26365 [Alphaproteobacteria bacterium]|nr:hypothetical protein [Alphaproteobacteria bacterium]
MTTRPARLSLAFTALGLLLGCEPPPYNSDSGGSKTPSIDFIFPISSADVVLCNSFMVSVDIDNLTLNPGFYESELEPTEGEGHWHLNLPAGLGGGVVALGEPYGFVDVSDQNPDPNTTYAFEAELVDNTHVPLPGIAVDVVEVRIDESDTDGDGNLDCQGGGAGYGSDDDTGG